MYAFDAVDGSSQRHRERLLAVPSGLIEQHDGVGVLREARGEAIDEYIHGVGIDLGEDKREGIVSGRPHGGIEVGGNEALVGEARRTLALRSCLCIGRDPGGRKQNEKGVHKLNASPMRASSTTPTIRSPSCMNEAKKLSIAVCFDGAI